MARDEASGSPAPGARRFGAAGLPPGVRGLGRAFTRALPKAVGNDAVWHRLPADWARLFAVALRIDEDRHIAEYRVERSEQAPERSVAPHLLELVRRAIAMLGMGEFALDEGSEAKGWQRLEVSVRLSATQPHLADGDEPWAIHALGLRDRRRDGCFDSYVTWASGKELGLAVCPASPARAPLP